MLCTHGSTQQPSKIVTLTSNLPHVKLQRLFIICSLSLSWPPTLVRMQQVGASRGTLLWAMHALHVLHTT